MAATSVLMGPLNIPIIIVSNWKGFLGEEITELTRPDAPLLDDPEFAAAWEHGRIIAVIGNDEPTRDALADALAQRLAGQGRA
jgi:hypothetical protein